MKVVLLLLFLYDDHENGGTVKKDRMKKRIYQLKFPKLKAIKKWFLSNLKVLKHPQTVELSELGFVLMLFSSLWIWKLISETPVCRA